MIVTVACKNWVCEILVAVMTLVGSCEWYMKCTWWKPKVELQVARLAMYLLKALNCQLFQQHNSLWNSPEKGLKQRRLATQWLVSIQLLVSEGVCDTTSSSS